MKHLWKIVVAVTLIAVIAVLALTVDWKSLGDNKTTEPPVTEIDQTTPEPEPEPEPTPTMHFYNLDLQEDEDEANNFNFGPNPYTEEKTVDDYADELYARMKLDRSLAVAVTAHVDDVFGTRFLEGKDPNLVKDQFVGDHMAFYAFLDRVFTFFGEATSVEIRQCKDVKNLMFMNPITVSGAPDIVMMEMPADGHQIVYTFSIKGTEVRMALRIECGFQPCTVSTVKATTPAKPPAINPAPINPIPSTDFDPIPSTEPQDPIPSTNSHDPSPNTTPTYPNPKDPSKAPTTNTELNDDLGPGPDTNNPKDPWHSTEDRPTNSTYYPSYDDYRDWMDQLAEINQTQQTPQNNPNNTPSTSTPPNTTVDSNADKGTGYGGINDPTPVSPPATDASTNAPIVNNENNPAGSWGGPPD